VGHVGGTRTGNVVTGRGVRATRAIFREVGSITLTSRELGTQIARRVEISCPVKAMGLVRIARDFSGVLRTTMVSLVLIPPPGCPKWEDIGAISVPIRTPVPIQVSRYATYWIGGYDISGH